MIKRLFNRLFPKKYTLEEMSEMTKQNLLAHGATIGSNVDIILSNIEERNAKFIKIGDNVTITNATVLTHDASTKKSLGYTKLGTVEIGNNVFIGLGSIVLPGTKIGDNVIVGAGTVVRGNVSANSVIVGNPCTKICDYDKFVEKHKYKMKDNIYDFSLDELNDTNNCDINEKVLKKQYGYFL